MSFLRAASEGKLFCGVPLELLEGVQGPRMLCHNLRDTVPMRGWQGGSVAKILTSLHFCAVSHRLVLCKIQSEIGAWMGTLQAALRDKFQKGFELVINRVVLVAYLSACF